MTFVTSWFRIYLLHHISALQWVRAKHRCCSVVCVGEISERFMYSRRTVDSASPTRPNERILQLPFYHFSIKTNWTGQIWHVCALMLLLTLKERKGVIGLMKNREDTPKFPPFHCTMKQFVYPRCKPGNCELEKCDRTDCGSGQFLLSNEQ